MNNIFDIVCVIVGFIIIFGLFFDALYLAVIILTLFFIIKAISNLLDP